MGSEMCIRDRLFTKVIAEAATASGATVIVFSNNLSGKAIAPRLSCLLYTSDAADERSSVDLGGRRIIKKKNSDASGGGEWCTINSTRQ